MIRITSLLYALGMCSAFASAANSFQNESSEANVYSDTELFKALCAGKSLVWIRSDLDLREEHWPTDCKSPVVLQQNLTISGPLDEPLTYTVSFNFMAQKVVIPPLGEVRLRHFNARNTRRGGGGAVDFIAYSPQGILWNDDLNKNQIICLHTTPESLMALPLPMNCSEFARETQLVEMWASYCTSSRCWQEVLHYEHLYTDITVDVGLDTKPTAYVIAKRNSSKTCDAFVSNECLQSKGGPACLDEIINSFLTSLPAIGEGREVRPLPIALSVALGGTALVLAIAGAGLLLRRQRRLQENEAATAAKVYDTSDDLEAPGGADGGQGVPGGKCGDCGGSKTVDSRRSGSKESGSSSEEPHCIGSPSVAAPDEEEVCGTEDSFRYATGDHMARCLSTRRYSALGLTQLKDTAGAAQPSKPALVEGIMQDGSVCTFAVGSPLGQGSFGAVFKGTWQDKPVAVKLVLCDLRYSEQVGTEVRLMTSEAGRHPNLLRAYAYMTRTNVVNRQQAGGQAPQSTIRGLVSSSARLQISLGLKEEELAMSSCSKMASEQLAETWIVSEFCDLGALAPHVHAGKRFLFPLDDITPTSTAVTDDKTTGITEGWCAALEAASAASEAALEAPIEAGREKPSSLRRPRMFLILTVLRDISAGMVHLHLLNIVHGDLKLANILMCSSGSVPHQGTAADPTAGAEGGDVAHEVTQESDITASKRLGLFPQALVAKVADFGLSRALKEGQTHHSTKTVGTVTHMPPELLRSGKLTLSSDVYGFGIIMWELLTGSVPYKGLMYGEVVERVVVSHRLPQFPDHTPSAYRALAERCWAADAAARPTFNAVLAEVAAMLAGAAALQAESDSLYYSCR